MARTAKVQSKNEPQSMELVPSQRVVQANQLIRAKQDRLTIFEARLLRLAISQILKDDTDFKTYKITVSQLARLLNMPKSNIGSIKYIDDSLHELKKKVVRIETENSIHYFSWVDSIYLDKKKKVITFRLSDDLKPYLLGLNELFTLYEYENILELPTEYSIRLYELLYSYRGSDWTGWKVLGKPLKKNQVPFEVSYLREYTNCESKYPNNSDFIKYIIEASVKAINKISDWNLKITIEPRKDGRTIKYIIFKYLSLSEYNKMLDAEAKKKAQKSMQKLIKEKSL